MVLSMEMGKVLKRIFIFDREQVGGWWKLMRMAFELADKPIENPDMRGMKVSVRGRICKV